MARPSQVFLIVGARPNFMKAAPLHDQLSRSRNFEPVLVHTGQHYDATLSEIFFRQLGLPRPRFHLHAGVDSGGLQVGRISTAVAELAREQRPDLVVVFGDVNSTVASALGAAACGLPVAHVEAGLRSFDPRMPEELNRTITDHLSDYLFVSEPSGVSNLEAEGIRGDDRVFLVGNVMIDSLVRWRGMARQLTPLPELGLRARRYVLVTLHRPSNVDRAQDVARWTPALRAIAARWPLIFPVHHRTRHSLRRLGLMDDLVSIRGLHVVEPLGYLEFLALMDRAGVVLTDSGGIQEETTFLKVPCLTLREATERPITVEMGTNRLVPQEPDAIIRSVVEVMEGGGKQRTSIPPLWDGRTAARIVQILDERGPCDLPGPGPRSS